MRVDPAMRQCSELSHKRLFAVCTRNVNRAPNALNGRHLTQFSSGGNPDCRHAKARRTVNVNRAFDQSMLYANCELTRGRNRRGEFAGSRNSYFCA